METKILVGHVLDKLKEIPAGSVQTCVTSPPYYGLREYGTEPQVWGGDAACGHEWGEERVVQKGGVGQNKGLNNGAEYRQERDTEAQTLRQGRFCQRCGAWRGSLGMEPTPELYVEHLVEVFREVRRVLRDDGTLWFDIGDSFASTSTYNAPRSMHTEAGWKQTGRSPNAGVPSGLKAKDLMMIPARVALALQADGWFLRCDMIWAKTASLPESVRDRPTRSHEYVFLLSKRERYFYDSFAVREPSRNTGGNSSFKREGSKREQPIPGHSDGTHRPEREDIEYRGDSRNLRSVLRLPPEPFPGAHFAVMPTKLAAVCVVAGTSAKGQCPTCGAPWKRVVERGGGPGVEDYEGKWKAADPHAASRRLIGNAHARRKAGADHDNPFPAPVTKGWEATCDDGAAEPIQQLVLDPFCGSGTVGVVCRELQRDFVGIELNPDYAAMAEKRIAGATFREEPKPEGQAALPWGKP